MASERDIKYLGRDFSSIRQEFIEFTKNYFPDTYNDFSESSPGMMFMEMVAYVGDILSFYTDTGIQETFLQYAKNPASLYAMAYMMGYRPKVTTTANVELTLNQKVSASYDSGAYEPDWSQACRVGENSVVRSESGVSFLTKAPVDFRFSSSLDPTEVVVSNVDDEGNPTESMLSKKVGAYSGEIHTVSRTYDTYEKFRTWVIEDANIVGILDMYDQDGNRWTEVPCLGQDTVFASAANSGSDSSLVPYVLELKKVSRRFVTRFNKDGNLVVQFGAGMYADDEEEQEFLPNPTSLDTEYGVSQDHFDVAYDPSNFLFSKSYGLAPVGTFTVRYLTGGGLGSNVEAGTINQIESLNLDKEEARDNITVYNVKAAEGGRNGDTSEEIRQNALRSFAEQKRAVTLQDYNVRALSIPPIYGNVAKVYATNNTALEAKSILQQNPLAISMYVLTYDNDGKLTQASATAKNNLKTYMSEYLMLTDALDILDAYVVNIGIRYDIVLKPGFESKDVLTRCSQALKDYFKTEARSINQIINIAEVQTLINQVPGVQVVKSVEILNKLGEGYAEYAYDISAATRNGIVYPSKDPCIFEVRYPDIDIEGRITTL